VPSVGLPGAAYHNALWMEARKAHSAPLERAAQERILGGMFGFFCIHKPAGPTSHDVVALVRRRLGRGAKVGHAGTLDPFAEGVLVLCVGPATRLASYVQARPKRYRAVVRLGATSTTDDPEGEIAAKDDAPMPEEAAVRAVVQRFVGTIDQVPPAHSAVHVGGRRAYKLARAGRPVDLHPRPVEVHAIDVLSYEFGRLRLDIRCGTGTYVRALARDIGAALGTGGYCEQLVRTAVGEFRIEDAVRPEELVPPEHLLPAALAVAGMPRVIVSADQAEALRHGKRLALPDGVDGDEIALFSAAGELLAIAEPRDDGAALQPTRVFLNS